MRRERTEKRENPAEKKKKKMMKEEEETTAAAAVTRQVHAEDGKRCARCTARPRPKDTQRDAADTETCV